MRNAASVAVSGSKYSGLVARLADVRAPNGPLSSIEAEDLADAHRKRLFRTSFACGLITSLVLGAAALAPLVYAHPGSPRNQGIFDAAETQGFARSPVAATRSAGPEIFHLPVRYAERGNTSFPLQLAEAGANDGVRILLRDVPEPAWLSSGVRQDEHTWLLHASDLRDLRLSLREGTPDAFDISIEVSTSAGPASRSVAQVRVLGRPQQAQADQALIPAVERASLLLPTAQAAAAFEAPQKPHAKATVGLADTARQKSAQKPAALAVPRPHVAAIDEIVPSAVARPARPEGMSTLGALPRAEPAAEEGRLLWWKLPTPSSWSPFADLPGRH